MGLRRCIGIVPAIGGGVRLLACILDGRERCGVHRPDCDHWAGPLEVNRAAFVLAFDRMTV
jgi:hypothetical protein